MIPLQKNLENLQGYFGDFHAAVTAQKAPGQKLLTNCLAECHATNEVVGIEYYSPKRGTIRLLHPVFIAGTDDHDSLLRMAVGNKYADLLEDIKDRKERYLEFSSSRHWHNDHLLMLNKVECMDDPEKMLELSALVALSILKGDDDPIAMVCGPISTGFDSIANNLYKLNRTIMEVGKIMPVFNELPFEGVFARVRELLSTTQASLLNLPHDASREEVRREKSIFIIQRFYERIIKEGHRKWVGCFMKDWHTSIGATMEHSLLSMLKFKVLQLETCSGFLN